MKSYYLKKRIATGFGTKIKKYERYAIIQRKLCDIIFSYIIENITIIEKKSLWADLGCGDGYLIKKLQENNLIEEIIGVDIAYEALLYGKKKSNKGLWICADIESLPLKNSLLNGIITTSVLQWTFEPKITIKNILNTLKEGGIYIFSVFIEEAFEEFLKIKKMYNYPSENIITIFRKGELEQILRQNRMREIYCKEYEETLYFQDAYSFLKHFSNIGATGGGSLPILSRKELKKFCALIEKELITPQGIPLKYKTMIGIFKKEGEK